MSTIDKYNRYVERQRRKYNHQRGKHSHLRDSQQTKCYSAEWKYLEMYPELKECMSKEDAEKFFKRITKSKMWKDNGWPTNLVWLKDMGDKRRLNGYAQDGMVRTVSLSPSGCSKYTIIHELTHCMGYWNHDRLFRIWLVKMVSRFFGVKEAKDLKQCFKDKGLKMSKPREPLAYGQWLEKYNRLVNEK